MIVCLNKVKSYLRVDTDEDDGLLRTLVRSAEKQCMDILRTDDIEVLKACPNGKLAVLFAVAYYYEHREEADHHALNLTLRALLFGSREVGF